LTGLVDSDSETCQQAAGKWGCAGFRNLDELVEIIQPDVISICTPTALHAEHILLAAACHPKLIIAEKPLTGNPALSREIIETTRAAGVELLVNYTRRYVPFFRNLRERIQRGEERVTAATIRYAKGAIHNGTHAVDLARFLFGEVLSAQAFAARDDFWPDDPTVTGMLQLEHCAAMVLQGLDERVLTCFEVDIQTDRARYVVDQDGLRLRKSVVEANPRYPGLMTLSDMRMETTGHEQAILFMLDHVCRILENGDSPLCSGEDALAAEEIALKLRGHAREAAVV